MSELTFATAGGAERVFNFKVEDPSVRAGAAVFFEVVREVTERDADEGKGHPLAVRAWVLDGPKAGTVEEDLWIWPKGIRDQIGDKTPGAKAAGRLEIYKNRGQDRVGLTAMTDEQRKLAEAKNEELKSGGGDGLRAPAGKAAKSDDEPPFHNGFMNMRPGGADEVVV